MNAVVERIAGVLRRAAGLEVELVGEWSVERAVSDRIEVLRAHDASMDGERYLALIENDLREQQWLVEAVVVPETWFFRHAGAFDLLIDTARRRLVQAGASATLTPLRIASIPCSTGEEPYSIAMALLDAGLNAKDFTIDAIDISSLSLEQARAGLYRRNAFRGKDLGFRERYFTQHDDAWVINPVVRESVTFRTGNLVADNLFPLLQHYDFIFCRNVLIYFDRPTQLAVIGRLRDSLYADGYLLVGPAETALVSKAGLAATSAPFAFAFQAQKPTVDVPDVAGRALPPATKSALPRSALARPRAPSAPPSSVMPTGTLFASHHAADAAAYLRPPSQGLQSAKLGGQLHQAATARAGTGTTGTVRAKAVTTRSVAAPSSAPASAHETKMAAAMQLADLGQLGDAQAACKVILADEGPSADLYCLLGVIKDALGQKAEAREEFRRALYLDAAHVGALMQLSTHLSMEGDEAGAARLMSRARRARPDLF